MKKPSHIGVYWGNLVLNNRLIVMVLAIALVVLAANGIRYIGFDTDYRVFFSDKNPQLQAFEELQKVYSKTDSLVFVLKAKSGDVFTTKILEAVKKITKMSWQLPHSTRVDSITNFQHTYAKEDDLTVANLVEGDPKNLTQKQLKKLKDIVMNEPLLVNRVISKDATTTGVAVTFYFPQKDAFEVPQAAAAAKKILEEIKQDYPNITLAASGVVVMNNAFSESSQNDLQSLIPIMYGLLIVSMVVFLRSFYGTIATLFVIAFSAVSAMGIAGWMGTMLTPPSASAPTIILTLAIADSVHIIVSMLKEMKKGTDKRSAIIESLRINIQPVFLTTLTTIIGFLSLNFSDAPPFHDLGNITAIGVGLAFVYSMTLLPVLLDILPMTCKLEGPKNSSKIEIFANFIVKKRKTIAISSLLIVTFLGISIHKIEINDEFVKYFDESMQFRQDAEFMMENLTGIYQIEYSLGAKDSNGISDPEYLNNLEKFSQWLNSRDEVVHVYSIADIFKRLNKNMHADKEAFYAIPKNREMAAQYLLLYEMSLPYGLDLNNRINIDKSASRLTVTLKDMSTNEIKAFKNLSEEWIKSNTPKYMHTNSTSPVIMFAYISERNIDSMIKGNIIALVIISICIMIALKSVKIGVFSLVPNIVPAIMGFGIWALTMEQVNMAVAIVTAVSLGIIVDDTVHFLSKYHRARNEKSMNAEEAVKYAFSTVGSALIITTAVLVIGFSVLIFSDFLMNSTLGILTATTIACALVADFFLLPPLLIFFDKRRIQNEI